MVTLINKLTHTLKWFKESKYFYGMDHLPKGYPTLNDRLRKAWLYGYIDKQTYTHFEVV